MEGLRRRTDDAGATLVEVLVALSILSIAAVSVLAGLDLSVKTSSIHRNESTSSAYVRSVGEQVQDWVSRKNTNYRTCAGAGYYFAAGRVSASLPAGYSVTQAAAEYWTGTAWSSASCTDAKDGGVQRVLLTVTSIGDTSHKGVETLYLVLRRPCNTAITSSTSKPCTG